MVTTGPGAEWAEQVLHHVEAVPRGRVTTYGAIADHLGGGPRQVASVLARDGGGVPWWRVVRADGTLPPALHDEASQAYAEEGTALRPRSGNPLKGRPVDLSVAFWTPAPDRHEPHRLRPRRFRGSTRG